MAAVAALTCISVGTLYQKLFGQNINLLTGSLFQYISAATLMALLAELLDFRPVGHSNPVADAHDPRRGTCSGCQLFLPCSADCQH